MKLVGSVKLKIFVFIAIFVSIIFILPTDLVAEIQKFWVDTSHWETRPTEWVEEGHWQVTP